MDLKVRKVFIEIEEVVCPKCDRAMIEETDPDALTMWHYKCTCGYKH